MDLTGKYNWKIKLLLYMSVILMATTPTTSAATQKFGVLLDAGSTGTKLKVYRWTPPTEGKAVPQIELIKSQKFSPGVSTFLNDFGSTALRSYLTEIIQSAQTVVPTTQQATTLIYLMATAGLRYDNAGDITHLLSRIEDIFKDLNTNPFLYTPGGATVLSGEEEGVYAWVALNYLLGFFDCDKPAGEATGIMEMGGSSTQIAFIPKGPLLAEEFHVTVAGKLYQLYVQSYLDYGIEAMKNKIARYLHNQSPYDPVVYNPCLLKGTETVGKDLLVVRGSSNPQQCKEIIDTFVASATGEACIPGPCAVGSHYQPDLSGINFYATQGFTHAPVAFNSMWSGNLLYILRLFTNANGYCYQSLQDIKNAGGDTTYASDNCMMGIYITALFTSAYGFPWDTKSITVTSKIDGQSIDWALGAMLMQLSRTHTGDSQAYAVNKRR